jgi:hypothetical protein
MDKFEREARKARQSWEASIIEKAGAIGVCASVMLKEAEYVHALILKDLAEWGRVDGLGRKRFSQLEREAISGLKGCFKTMLEDCLYMAKVEEELSK